MLEVAFRLRHDCEVNRLSRRHPDVLMAQWCNLSVEVLEIHTRDAARAAAMERDLAELSKRGFKEIRQGRPGSAQLLLLQCSHEKRDTIDTVIERAGCLYIPPVVHQDGWEHYRVVAFDEDSLKTLFERLGKRGEVELTKKRDLGGDLATRGFMVSASSLLSDLTAKQASSLLTAIQSGYYQVPRKVRTEDIARRNHVPRTTFEEHVRKAESKIMRSMAPYVALYAGAGDQDQ